MCIIIVGISVGFEWARKKVIRQNLEKVCEYPQK